MKAALIGLPQSGKTTLFSTVTGTAIDPYAAPETHQAMVRVPDPRVDFLAEMWNPKKVTLASADFIDVPGCTLADSSGQEQWRRLLPTVRQADLLVVVVRDFENASVPAHRDRVDADADLALVWEELIFADLDTVTTRIERIEQALKKPTKTHESEKRELVVLERCREALESEKPLADVLTAEDDRRQVASFGFLTEKPLVAVRNVSDDVAGQDVAWNPPHVRGSVSLSASIEFEIASLDEEDRAAFMDDLGIKSSARDKLIQSCYSACGLISFLTMGADEVRAWTITKGNSAVQAAGKIHTDLARGFIRAETVSFDDFKTHGDMKGAKAAGRVRKEGKTYIVEDGDILNILANV